MLVVRNTAKGIILSIFALAVIAGTAAGARNENAAQRSAPADRQAENQARIAQRQAQSRAAAEQRQAAAAQRQAENQARMEANKQAAAERAAQVRANIQQNIANAKERQSQRQAAAAQRQAENQSRMEANKQAAAERAAQVRANIQQNIADAKERQSQRQAESQARVESNRQAAAERRAEVITDRSKGEWGISRDVNREVNVQRIVGPGGTKVVSERSFSATTTINGRTFNNNIHTKVVSNIAPISRSFSRPRAFKDGYHYGDRDSGGIHWRRQVHGNRPGVVFRHIVWPSYGYPVYYRHGPDIFFSYFRPSYHRKYIFVSIGNYWPVYYTSLRYYWYGWYPYTWYGCYPTAYEVCGDTYNYYTYNTYNYEFGSSSGYIGSEYSAPLADVDETTFADIRQKLAEQARQQPEDATLTDKFFDDGVEAFEQGDYVKAAAAFADAIALEPNDLILPFAYVQALFACEQYGKAADILRMALVQMPADQQGLFFPRGLYSDDNVLLEQVEKLQDRADVFAYDPDMSLLLGYQLIGIEQYDQARRWLEQAGQYDINNKAVTILLDLLDKLGEQRQDVSQNI